MSLSVQRAHPALATAEDFENDFIVTLILLSYRPTGPRYATAIVDSDLISVVAAWAKSATKSEMCEEAIRR